MAESRIDLQADPKYDVEKYDGWPVRGLCWAIALSVPFWLVCYRIIWRWL